LTLTNGKRDLTIEPPLMNSAGILGFSDEGRNLVDLRALGAFVTNPITQVRRSPAHGPNVMRYAGGFLLHTGHPNPGLSSVMRLHRRRWQALPCPLILHLQSEHPTELGKMLRRLESAEEVAGVEIGLAADDLQLAEGLIREAVASQLPVLARIPLNLATAWARIIAELGVAAVVIGPPRGRLATTDGVRISGRLYGPALFPLALEATNELIGSLSIPLIASGGIGRRSDVDALMRAGAAAVQLDFALWTEPEAVLGTQEEALQSSFDTQ
jgi:dihydroorotate dehydrogenase (NAD+) catalytic subunit